MSTIETIITSIYSFYDDWGLISQYMIGELSPLQTSNKYLSLAYLMMCVVILVIVFYNTQLKSKVPNKLFRKGVVYIIVLSFAIATGLLWLYNDYYAGKMVTIDYATGLMMPIDIDPSMFWSLAWNNSIVTLIILTLALTVNHFWQLKKQ